jgi:hypothetical protein
MTVACLFMKAIDRVMKAYSSTRELSSQQPARVRAELSKFIDELMSGEVSSKPPTSSDSRGGLMA